MFSDLQRFLNDRVINRVRGRVYNKAGDLFGLELECEGRNVDYNDEEAVRTLGTGWTPHRDGSLRNTHGQACEWVFASPCNYATSVKRVEKLFEYFSKRKAKLVCSNRTSLHVHYNMSDKNCYQVVNTFILFTILEDILDRYCGEDRNGNLFCLSSRHAEAQLNLVSRAIFDTHNFLDIEDNNRYCSLNLASLNKFGTVEFRGMRGLDNKEEVLRWLSIVNDLCTYSCYTMRNPVEIIENISIKSPHGILKEIFSEENYSALVRDVPFNEISDSIYEGLRLVQMICYRVGTEFDGVVIKGKDFWETLNPSVVMEEHPIEEDPRRRAVRDLQELLPRGAMRREQAGQLVDWARIAMPAPRNPEF